MFPAEWFVETSMDLQSQLTRPLHSRRVGRCIYCPATEGLRREHIVPAGLNGDWTLLEASCKKHESITSAFETDVLRHAFGWVRTALNMRTRRREERPTALPFVARRGSQTFNIDVPVADYPAVATMPPFAPPNPEAPEGAGMTLTGEVWMKQLAGPNLRDVIARVIRDGGYDYVGLRLVYQPVEFARLLAKIGYGFAVLQLGLDAVADAYVLPAILGDTSRIHKWVGTSADPPRIGSQGLHGIEIRSVGDEIHAYIRLFAQFEAPEYHVIVGRRR